MKPNAKDFLKVASLLAVLAAGSCAAPMNDPAVGLVDDPDVNHPVMVQPNYHSLNLPFSAVDAGLMPDDAQRFESFLDGYMQHGNGAISISAPAGMDAQTAIRYFGERIASAGVPRERILVGTHPANDGKVELGYIAYDAQVAACADWTTNLADTSSNRVNVNLGCATQHNLAAQIADPRDLIAPQTMGPGDAARRATVYGNYKDGKPTGATLTPDQSAAVSDVAK